MARSAGHSKLRPDARIERRAGRVSTLSDSASMGRSATARLSSRHGLPSTQVAEIQRSRLLAGAVAAIEEHGYAHMTVAQITGRSRVSRRTFYELFENREACLAALIEDVLGMVEGELARAELGDLPWRERVRGGLAVILGFLDREPVLARVFVVQSAQGGSRVLAQREQILVRLAAVLDEGRKESALGADCSTLTAEGLLGAVLGIVHARLAHGEHRPLADLQGELTGMIVLPYLGVAAARRERTRKAIMPTVRDARVPGGQGLERDPLEGIQIRMTYRTARVLEVIGERAGLSNRLIAEHAGIQDQGQVSKLLARLERLGLAQNSSHGRSKGDANAWSLTPRGERVAQRLSSLGRAESSDATAGAL